MYQGITGLKRVRTKNGRTYYYLNGKRVSSKVASDFQRKDSAKRSARAKKAAKELLYYKGKALKKDESYLVKLVAPKLKTNKLDDLFKSRAAIDRAIVKSAPKGFELPYTSERGAFKNGYEGEVERKGVQSLAELFLESGLKDYKVILTTPKLERKTGAKRVLNYLTNFEVDRINDIRSVDPNLGVKATFKYKVTISYRMKQIYLDLTDRDKKKSFKEEFEEGTGDAIPNKYKDLDIILATSI